MEWLFRKLGYVPASLFERTAKHGEALFNERRNVERELVKERKRKAMDAVKIGNMEQEIELLEEQRDEFERMWRSSRSAMLMWRQNITEHLTCHVGEGLIVSGLTVYDYENKKQAAFSDNFAAKDICSQLNSGDAHPIDVDWEPYVPF